MAHGAYSVLASKKHTIQIGAMHGLPVLQTRMLWVELNGTRIAIACKPHLIC